MITKTVKIKIRIPIDNTWDEVNRILGDLRYHTSKMLNYTIQQCYEWLTFKNKYKEENGEYPKDKEVFGCSHRNHIYRQCTEKFPIFNTGNISQTVGMGTSRWSSDVKDIMSLRKSIPSYKLQVPIYISGQSYSLKNIDNDYIADVGLLSKKYAMEQLGSAKTRYRFQLVVEDNSTKTILDRLIHGKYKQGYGQIVKDKKGKWYLSIAYSLEAEAINLNTGRVMGIDLGISYPVYMAFNDSLHRYKIKGGEIEHFRKQIERRKNELLDQGKYCGDGRKGKGIKTRIEPIEFAREKIKNFRNTTNHKYSRFVVEMAVKHEVEIIQMEKLEGISEESTFLKNWSYYDLQQKIEYKAKEKGIKVMYIDPYKTSQRCSKCGHIDSENREDQSTFLCKKCGFAVNADYNAAKNISIVNIEKIIKEACKEQEPKR